MKEFVIKLTDEQIRKLGELVDYEIKNSNDVEHAIRVLIEIGFM